MSSLRHAGWKFPYRHPPASGAVEKTLSGLGAIVRALGNALDEFGAILQGPGALKETVQPNLAWAPTQPDAQRPSVFGQTVKVPAVTRIPPLKQVVVPVKGDNVFIAPSANVLGDVKLGSNSSIWYGAILRGDVNGIHVGSNTNIQDNAVVHVSKYALDGEPKPTVIGDNVTIGHGATVHACTIKDNSLVGMGATVLDGAEVGPGSIVAAGAVVPPKTKIPPGEVWAGNPAKKLRAVEPEEKEFITASAQNYSQLAAVHQFENGKSFEELVTEGTIEVERHIASDPTNSVHQMWVFDSQTMIAIRPKK